MLKTNGTILAFSVYRPLVREIFAFKALDLSRLRAIIFYASS